MVYVTDAGDMIALDDRGGFVADDIRWEVLEALPTLNQGYTADLKIETDEPRQRVWLERTTTADGEHCDHHVTVETYDGRAWVTTSEN